MTLNAAYEAFIEAAAENSPSEPRAVKGEAYDEAVTLELAAKHLLAAVEAYRATVNGMDYVGKILSTPQELVDLIIDYDQDWVGHAASDVLRASIRPEPAKPSFLQVAKEVVG